VGAAGVLRLPLTGRGAAHRYLLAQGVRRLAVSARAWSVRAGSVRAMTDSTQRPAEPGELCTCGRPAVVVFSNEEFGDVGYCGIEGSQGRPVLPCPWCGSTKMHTAPWGDPGKCPDYQLRAPVG
jgi:hypothetical protein